MGCGMVVCALLVSLLVIIGIAFFGKENPYRRKVRAFLTDVKDRQEEARATGADLFVSKGESPQRLLSALFSLI
jgi:hypothetical protein